MTNSTCRKLFQTRPMRRRDSNEVHRASTPLELLFDLVSVIAIATAAAGLHHAIAEAHFAEGIAKFIFSFFAIWWAWMNYTWFASAYDNDDAVFRILTMIIMSGSLVMAAGIGAFFESLDITLMVIGYVIMRLGMVVLWLRAAAGDSEGRPAALTYALGFALTQVFWIILLIALPIPTAWFYGLFGVGIAVAVEIATHHAHVAEIVGNYAIAVPVAVYTGGLWLVRDRYALNRSGRFVLPTFAIVVLILAAMPFAIEMIALSLLLATVLRSHLARAENGSVSSVT